MATLPLERVRGVFERSPVALTLCDLQQADAPLVLANERFSNLTGYGASEIIGRNCRFLQGAEDNEAARAEIRDALARCHEVQVILRNYRKDGTPFDNLLFLNPVGGDGRYMLGSQFGLTGTRSEPLTDAASRHVQGLSADLQRLAATSDALRNEQRRHMADVAAGLVTTWLRSQR
ncbi:PAS domain-containing protein [Plastorhodobacter daqingensis]|uniref:PAS domain-containing protein n=1 Tax=Plastorhodobacter daqingensis TaxID=1387281 RepID=A0ABW2UL44_9RHOB